MSRLTKREWEIINSALALYQANVVDFDLPEAEEAKLNREVEDVRLKVHERLG
jgi:hypothetical protein